jgi:predicted glycosyltransferase
MARVLISVTHLLGTGHLSRALTLAHAFSVAGHDAHVMSGGMPAPNLSSMGVTLHQIPPVKSDGVNFTTLLTEDGLANEDYLADRKQAVLRVLHDVAPDVLITELYPFGRRVLKGEFLSVLNAARDLEPKPLIYSSIRDILAPPSKPKKVLETEAVLAAYYDAVLVHSDVDVTPLDVSWPVTPMLQEKLSYTGFVVPPPADPHPKGEGFGEVLVTAGGGDVGMDLFRAALQAAMLEPETTFRLLVGGSESAANTAVLRAERSSNNVIIEPTRPDFRQMLTGAKATISMCGYNTAMDVLQSQTPAVFVPFDAGGEVEQTLRAESLAQRDGFAVVKADEASGCRLVYALRAVCLERPAVLNTEHFDGAINAVKIVEHHLEELR